jgi:hypothetical protein
MMAPLGMEGGAIECLLCEQFIQETLQSRAATAELDSLKGCAVYQRNSCEEIRFRHGTPKTF